MSTGITVATASMPSRRAVLAECADSLYAQTVQPDVWLTRVEDPGPAFGMGHLAHQRNALLKAVETEWVATLDDDDLLDPNYFETLIPHLSDKVDVVYGQCRGRNHTRSPVFDPVLLRSENYICGVAIVRASAARAVGGWREDGFAEDWGMWLALEEAGAHIVCVNQELWTHRRVDGVRTIT